MADTSAEREAKIRAWFASHDRWLVDHRVVADLLAMLDSERAERDAVFRAGVRAGVEASVEHWRIDSAMGDEIDAVCARVDEIERPKTFPHVTGRSPDGGRR